MFVKKFEAPSLDEALNRVKRELGPSALILATQERTKGLFQKRMFEVTAAFETKAQGDVEYDELALEKVFPHRKNAVRDNRVLSSIRKGNLDRYADLSPIQTKPKKEPPSLVKPFLRTGMSTESASELSQLMFSEYSSEDLKDPVILERAMIKVVAEQVATVPPPVLPSHGGVFVGYAGSGKTSIVVKIAITLKQRGHPVTLVSLDKRKMFASHELSGYARILGIPYLATLREGHREELQLIDTSSLVVGEGNQELKQTSKNQPVWLVLDASMRFPQLQRVVELASPLQPKGIFLTRFELLTEFGILFDLFRFCQIPFLGASLSQSFQTPLNFFESKELATLIVRGRNSL